MLFYNSFLRDLDFNAWFSEDLKFSYLPDQKGNEDGSVDIYIEVPGITKDVLEIEQENDMIYVSAKKKVGNRDKIINRRFKVSEEYDGSAMKATLSDGVLVLNLPLKKSGISKRNKVMVT